MQRDSFGAGQHLGARAGVGRSPYADSQQQQAGPQQAVQVAGYPVPAGTTYQMVQYQQWGYRPMPGAAMPLGPGQVAAVPMFTDMMDAYGDRGAGQPTLPSPTGQPGARPGVMGPQQMAPHLVMHPSSEMYYMPQPMMPMGPMMMGSAGAQPGRQPPGRPVRQFMGIPNSPMAPVGMSPPASPHMGPGMMQPGMHMAPVAMAPMALSSQARPQQAQQEPRRRAVQRGLEENVKRTVYVSYVDVSVTEEQLASFFSQCGPVMDCRICGDPNSAMRFAFLEFADTDSAQKALSKTGSMLGGWPLRVQPSKTAIVPVSKELMPRSEDEVIRCSRTVYVASIDKRVERSDVRAFFEQLCGPVAKLRLLGDASHNTRIAFVEFVTAEGATAALNCSGALLGALPVRVSPSKTPIRSDVRGNRNNRNRAAAAAGGETSNTGEDGPGSTGNISQFDTAPDTPSLNEMLGPNSGKLPREEDSVVDIGLPASLTSLGEAHILRAQVGQNSGKGQDEDGVGPSAPAGDGADAGERDGADEELIANLEHLQLAQT